MRCQRKHWSDQSFFLAVMQHCSSPTCCCELLVSCLRKGYQTFSSLTRKAKYGFAYENKDVEIKMLLFYLLIMIERMRFLIEATETRLFCRVAKLCLRNRLMSSVIQGGALSRAAAPQH
ncbi:hypothetical protein GOODEAATRI_009555 [Goodea atripinnis]|uniref:Uncharacterized protein n=1 Tax=Goodea atripinnis TaxID=208336 RepID=A0ABV0MQR2_9TELE